MTRYAIVPAPGCSSNAARVYSTHRTLDAARKACGPRDQIIAAAGLRKGDRFYMDTVGTVYARADA